MTEIREIPHVLQQPEDIIRELEQLGPAAIVSEDYVAHVFGRCATSVRRAIERGELPPPVRMFGKRRWTAGAILSHLQARLNRAKLEDEETAKTISKHSP